MKSKKSNDIKHPAQIRPLASPLVKRDNGRVATQQQLKSGKSSRGFTYNCSGCNKPIRRDKYLLKACDKYWHENCLRCDRCQSRLGELGSTLFCKFNMILCRHDYLEMFGETGICSVCEKIICASEMVMRAKQNVYHLECFACQLCSQRFCVGDRFYLCENKVVCQYDYEEHILPIQASIAEQPNTVNNEVGYNPNIEPDQGDIQTTFIAEIEKPCKVVDESPNLVEPSSATTMEKLDSPKRLDADHEEEAEVEDDDEEEGEDNEEQN